MKIVELQDIHRNFGKGVEVLHGIDLQMEGGEVVALLGQNGAGKTTLLQITLGLLRPHEGSVRLFGQKPDVDPVALKRRIGYVSEDQLLPEFMTLEGILEVHRALFPTWDRSLEARLRRRFDLSLGREKLGSLSRGQARRVALLCAVAHRPELLILDEPAGGLDPAARREFLEVAIEALAEGATLLFSSHHMQDVERLAGRIAMIHDGHLLIDRPLDELRENIAFVAMPHPGEVGLAQLDKAQECLGFRLQEDHLHGLFEGQPQDLESELGQRFGVNPIRASRPALEDFFVEMIATQGARP